MYKHCSEVPFKNLVKFMQKCSEVPSKNKEAQFKAFLQYCVPRPSPDIFQIFRLLLPAEDAERVRYGLKEDKLAALLVKAAGLNEDSTNAKAAKNWKKGHVQNAGIFPEVMEQYVLRTACVAAADADSTTVGEVNSLLDRLAAAADFKQQVPVMRDIYQQCNAPQVKWLLRIILKDLKIGMSKERMLRLFHPDALDMLNITNSLQQVCEELAPPTHRMARKDIMPGCAIKMQLCLRANSLEEAFTRMKGKAFATEVKLDGYRMQIHVTAQEVMYFSRRGREHGKLSNYTVFDQVVREQVKLQEPDDAVILDGEVVVWNKTRGVFEAFGGVRSAMNAARERLPPDHVLGTKFEEEAPEDEITAIGAQEDSLKLQQEEPAEDTAATVADVELVYFAFDILYVGKESVINRPLHERHHLLQHAISCISAGQSGVPCNDSHIGGRVVALLPDQPVPLPLAGAAVEPHSDGAAAVSCAAVPDLVLSRTGRTLDDVQRMYDVAILRQDEGIVIKQLESPWKPDDRSGVWLKMKPDYTEQAEIDAVIIAAYYGAGRRGGQISEFLLALTDHGATGVWASFCKVATGIKDIERQQLWDRLAPVLMRNEPGVKPPRCYRLSGKEERPDFWISDPRRSVVLELKSDVRTIISKTFAIPYSLRFPRVTKICWDRAGDDIASCLDVERLVADNKGRLTDRQLGGMGGRRSGQHKAAARRTYRSAVVGVAQLPDVSAVEEQSAALAGKEVCVINYCDDKATRADLDAIKQEVGAIIKRNGGRQVVSPRPQTDYVLAAFLSEARACTLRSYESSSSKNAQRAYDVVSLEWLRDVDRSHLLLPVLPHHRLYLTSSTRLALAAAGQHDIYGNPFLLELQAEDVEALVSRLIPDTQLAKFQGHLLKGEAQLQQQLEKSATVELPALEEQGTAAGDNDILDNSSTAAVDTFRSVVQSVQQQLQLEAEWSDSSTTLFAQCCLLFVPYIPETLNPDRQGVVNGDGTVGTVNHAGVHRGSASGLGRGSTSLSQGSTADVVLLDCAVEGQAVAAVWREQLAQQMLADVKLAVMLHGGTVADTYTPQVTHIVLWPVETQKEQQWQQWLLQANCSSSEDALGSGTLAWPAPLLPGHQQQLLHFSAQQVLWQLAAVAEAAAESAAAAAAATAAAATQQAHPSVRKPQPRFSRLRPATPPPPVARSGSGRALGLLRFGSQGLIGTQDRGPGFSVLAGRQLIASPTAAADERHAKAEQESGAQDVTKAAAANQQLSPAGLKQLRLMRRRLISAQRSNLATGAVTAAATGDAAASDSKRTKARQAAAALNLVGPAWVIDSLADLKQQQQRQQRQQQQPPGRQVLIQRRSEMLYAPTVLVQQQPDEAKQAGNTGTTAAGAEAATEAASLGGLSLLRAAAAGANTDVHRWPWSMVGLSGDGGTGSSSGSADGCSDHSTDGQQRKQTSKRRTKNSNPTAKSRGKRHATPAATAVGDDEQQLPAAKRRARATTPAAAATAAEGAAVKGEACTAAGVAAPAERRTSAGWQKTQQGQAAPHPRGGKGRGRGRGRGRGSRRAGRIKDGDSSDTEEAMSDREMMEQESDTGSMSVKDGTSEKSVSQATGDDDADDRREGSDAADDSTGYTKSSAAAAAGSRKGTRQQQRRRQRLRCNAMPGNAASPDSEQPPGWLAVDDSQQQQQQAASQHVQAYDTTVAAMPKRRLLPGMDSQQPGTGTAVPAAPASATVVPAITSATAAPTNGRSRFNLASMIFDDDRPWQPLGTAPAPTAGTPSAAVVQESLPSSRLPVAADAATGFGSVAAPIIKTSASASARAAATGVPRRGGTLLSRWLGDDDMPAAVAAAVTAPHVLQAADTVTTAAAPAKDTQLEAVPETVAEQPFQQGPVPDNEQHQPAPPHAQLVQGAEASPSAASVAEQQAFQQPAAKRSLAALKAKFNL